MPTFVSWNHHKSSYLKFIFSKFSFGLLIQVLLVQVPFCSPPIKKMSDSFTFTRCDIFFISGEQNGTWTNKYLNKKNLKPLENQAYVFSRSECNLELCTYLHIYIYKPHFLLSLHSHVWNTQCEDDVMGLGKHLLR